MYHRDARIPRYARRGWPRSDQAIRSTRKLRHNAGAALRALWAPVPRIDRCLVRLGMILAHTFRLVVYIVAS